MSRFNYGLAESIKRDARDLIENTVDASYLLDRLNRIYKKSELLTRRMVEDEPTLIQPKPEDQAGPLIEVFYCCYCNEPATGRFCFVGKNDTVRDNPFCKAHRGQVYEQTHRALGVIHSPRSVRRDITAIQLWVSGQQPPTLPKNEAQLIMVGSRNFSEGRD
jgi:hypothetical protein